MPKSFAPQVIADNSGKWAGNALRFATRQEAELQVSDLAMRWFSVREVRVIESDDEVNYRYVEGKLVEVAPPRIHQLPSARVGECMTCDEQRAKGDTFHPPHDASSRCESGKRNHCSCDSCF